MENRITRKVRLMKSKHPTKNHSHTFMLLKALVRGRKLTQFDAINITGSPNGGRRLRDVRSKLEGLRIPMHAMAYKVGKATALKHFVAPQYRDRLKEIMGAK